MSFFRKEPEMMGDDEMIEIILSGDAKARKRLQRNLIALSNQKKHHPKLDVFLIKALNFDNKKVNCFAEVFLVEHYLKGFLFSSKKNITDTELRHDVFTDAVLQLFKKLQNKTSKPFRGEASIKTLFYKIWQDKYRDKIRHINTKKNQIAKVTPLEFEDYLSQLNVETRELITKALLEIKCTESNSIVKWVKKTFPTCFKILFLHNGLGYTYGEVAVELNSTKGSIKERARKCRNKINETYFNKFRKKAS